MSTRNQSTADLALRDNVQWQIEWDPAVDASGIGVSAIDATVTLTGYVDTYAGKLAAERAAKQVRGVRAVANDIEVRPRLDRTDTDIADDVVHALRLHGHVPEAVQATVRHGHVVLGGHVDFRFQKLAAEEAVRHVRGVRHIDNHITVSTKSVVRDVRKHIVKALHQNAVVDADHIEVSVTGPVATLSGTTGSLAQREAAEWAAAQTPGIAEVDNRLVVVNRELVPVASHGADRGVLTQIEGGNPASSIEQPMPGPLISVRELTRTYSLGDVPIYALRGVTLQVQRGEFIALTGPSGSGKSTFMNLLGCLDHPTSGEYWLNGQNVAALSRDELAEIRNRDIGFVFQGFNLLPRTSALDNVELPLLYAPHVPAHERHERAVAALASVGLRDRLEHLSSQMSGGQQQRVAIARALVNNPMLLLADEPTGNLDSKTSIEVIEILQRLNIDRGLTILLVTHEPDIAQYAARRIAFLDGRVRLDERVADQHRASVDLAAIAAGTEASPVWRSQSDGA